MNYEETLIEIGSENHFKEIEDIQPKRPYNGYNKNLLFEYLDVSDPSYYQHDEKINVKDSSHPLEWRKMDVSPPNNTLCQMLKREEDGLVASYRIYIHKDGTWNDLINLHKWFTTKEMITYGNVGWRYLPLDVPSDTEGFK